MDWTHGVTGYVAYKCRCDTCRAAWAVYMRNYRHRGRTRRLASPTLQHGTLNAYTNWACRCELCKAASSAQSARLRDRRRAKADMVTANGNGKH